MMFLLYPVRCLVRSLRDLRALDPNLIGSPHHSSADFLSSWYSSSRLWHCQFAKAVVGVGVVVLFSDGLQPCRISRAKFVQRKVQNQLWMVVQQSIYPKEIHKIIITGELCIVRWAQPKSDGECDYAGDVGLVGWWLIYFLALHCGEVRCKPDPIGCMQSPRLRSPTETRGLLDLSTGYGPDLSLAGLIEDEHL